MNKAIRAVLLRADGKGFCAGGDLSYLGQHRDVGIAIRELTADFHAAQTLFSTMQAPLICAVQGAAAGGGMALALIADYLIAGRSAFFAYAYQDIGLSADGGMSWTLPRLIGMRNFQKLYLSGGRVTAEAALGMGMISEIAEDDELDAKAHAYARRIADGPTLAYGAIKRLALAGAEGSLAAQLEAEASAISELSRSQDSRSAIAALLGKRKPVFKGQ
jgi:2-(1,2-epoxy-1,2-dihydrophenyl)acetyl-CoA isomerase